MKLSTSRMTSIASLQRISAADLSSLLLAQSQAESAPSNIAIIDVRDDDHIGGHIRGSTHVPSTTLDHQIPSLVRKLADKHTVVFHCALSQQRGPGAALRYMRERDRLLGSTAVGEAMRKDKKEEQSRAEKATPERKEDGEGWEDVDEVKETKEQRILVLDRGFVGWQEKYGKDERLTDGYREEIWREGYWM